MAPTEISGVNVPLFTGPLVLGYMWGYCLYGVLLIQIYIYLTHSRFPTDKLGLKILVWTLFTLETAFVFISTITAWNTFGWGWGDTHTLFFLGTSFGALPVLSGIISWMTQNFYLWRIWTLTKRNLMIIVGVEAVSLAQCIFAVYYGITLALHGGSVDEMIILSPFRIAWLIGCALCDILITITVVMTLRAQKDTSFKFSSKKINRSIRYSAETGAITTVMAVTEFVAYVAAKHHTFHLMLFLMLSEVYICSLVATLNAREPNSANNKKENFYIPSPPDPSLFRNDRTDSSRHNGGKGHEAIALPNVKISAPNRNGSYV